MVSVAIREPKPLVRCVRSRTVAKVDSMGLWSANAANVGPESRKRLTGLLYLSPGIRRLLGIWFDNWRETDRRLPALLCESAPGTFHGSVACPCPERPCALYPGCEPSYVASNVAGRLGHILLQGYPEAKRTVTDDQLRCAGQTQAFELHKQFAPGPGAFAITIDNRYHCFDELAAKCRSFISRGTETFVRCRV
jgi:hypothetical protein